MIHINIHIRTCIQIYIYMYPNIHIHFMSQCKLHFDLIYSKHVYNNTINNNNNNKSRAPWTCVFAVPSRKTWRQQSVQLQGTIPYNAIRSPWSLETTLVFLCMTVACGCTICQRLKTFLQSIEKGPCLESLYEVVDLPLLRYDSMAWLHRNSKECCIETKQTGWFKSVWHIACPVPKSKTVDSPCSTSLPNL